VFVCSFEDLPLDRDFVSSGRTLTEADIATFAELSGDTFPLHTNNEFAARSIYGRRVAHGMLVLSCSIGLAVQMNIINDSMLAFYGIDKLRFTKPVFPGDTITIRKRVTEKRALDIQRGLVTFDTKVINQTGHIVIAYVDKYLLKRSAVNDSSGQNDE
jgi:3-hydroxybutyryl-CoA dehydratase